MNTSSLKGSSLSLGSALLAGLCIAGACSSQRLSQLRSSRPEVAIASEEAFFGSSSFSADSFSSSSKEDGEDGHSGPIIMKAVLDSISGEMVAADSIAPAVVTARFRNIAERGGFARIAFDVTIPPEMLSSSWQVRLLPTIVAGEDTISLDKVLLTGEEYRLRQEKGYDRYGKFLSSLSADSLSMVWKSQLRLFRERNFPSFSMESVPSSSASSPLFSWSGISEDDAVEHYTWDILRWRHLRRLSSLPERFNRYVKAPFQRGGVLLDTLLHGGSSPFSFTYTYDLKVKPGLRRADLFLESEVHDGEKTIYRSELESPLSYYISSLSSMADTTERFIRRVISRRVVTSDTFTIGFPSGKNAVDPAFEGNEAELQRLRKEVKNLFDSDGMVLDSIMVKASCSPEGSFVSNSSLSRERGSSVKEYLSSYLEDLRDSVKNTLGVILDESPSLGDSRSLIEERLPSLPLVGTILCPEDWHTLSVLVERDSTLSQSEKESYFAATKEVLRLLSAHSEVGQIGTMKEDRFPSGRDYSVLSSVADYTEKLLQKESFHPYLLEKVYPRLRYVRLDFSLHRKGMVRDTVHTTLPDEEYRKGVEALRNQDYKKAASILGNYRDYNAALAFASLGYNHSALEILSSIPSSEGTDEMKAKRLYLQAVLLSRTGDTEKAMASFREACRLVPSMKFRGNLDPEITALLSLYPEIEESEI